MSDFDKEAERERLREKYEQDKEKRAATEQMSELLLQGATMTNAHCSQCGDPIFRYDGQEFCATCERPVDRGTAGEEDAGDREGGNAIEVTTPSDDTRVVFGQDGDRTDEGERSDAQSRDTAQHRTARQEASGDAKSHSRGGRQTTGSSPNSSAAGSGTRPDRTGDGTGIDDARRALVRTLVTFSERAAASDDSRQAKAHLEAAREAAETLAVLR